MNEEDQERLQELESINSEEEIANELKDRRAGLAIKIEQAQQQIDNCHDDELEDLQKQMMELKQLMKEIYPSDEDEGSTKDED